MKSLVRHFINPLLHIVTTALLLGGCATTAHNPISDTLTVERVSVPDTQLWRAEVTDNADGNGFTVSGELLPRWYLAARPKGHVDIEIIAPNKEILQRRCATYRVENLSRKQRRYLFRVAMSIVPPKNSVIRVTPHATALCNPSDGTHKIAELVGEVRQRLERVFVMGGEPDEASGAKADEPRAKVKVRTQKMQANMEKIHQAQSPSSLCGNTCSKGARPCA